MFFRLPEKGVEVKGVALMAGLTVLAVLESTLPFFCLSYKTQDKETTVTVLTVSTVSVVVAVSVMPATPLKLNPHPLSDFLIFGHLLGDLNGPSVPLVGLLVRLTGGGGHPFPLRASSFVSLSVEGLWPLLVRDQGSKGP